VKITNIQYKTNIAFAGEGPLQKNKTEAKLKNFDQKKQNDASGGGHKWTLFVRKPNVPADHHQLHFKLIYNKEFGFVS
jgi:hypothetical protein